MPPQHLDEKVKLVWFLPSVVSLFMIWLVVSGALLFAVEEQVILGMHKPLFSLMLFLFLAIFLALPIYGYHHIEYMSFTYELSEHEFIVRQGVFTRHTSVIPYNRIQNVNSTRTLLERLLGLATLQIETAGTNPTFSEGRLPGVSKKDTLIGEIMKRVERVKKSLIGPNGNVVKNEREILADILKEVQEIKYSIQKTTGRPKGEITLSPPSIRWRDITPGSSGVSKKEPR